VLHEEERMARRKQRKPAEDLSARSSKELIAFLRYEVAPEKQSEAAFNLDSTFAFTDSVKTPTGTRYEHQTVPRIGDWKEHERLAAVLGKPLVSALSLAAEAHGKTGKPREEFKRAVERAVRLLYPARVGRRARTYPRALVRAAHEALLREHPPWGHRAATEELAHQLGRTGRQIQALMSSRAK
jgi:hypothetical protein